MIKNTNSKLKCILFKNSTYKFNKFLSTNKYSFDNKEKETKEIDNDNDNKVNIFFKFIGDEFNKDKLVKAEIGKNLLDLFAENNFINIGVCGGQLACATCHCILPESLYDKNQIKSCEEEDLIDTAICNEETSRLGCQVTITKDFDNQTIILPSNSEKRNNLM